MDDFNPCSDRGDDVQNILEEVDEQRTELRERALGEEDDEKNVCEENDRLPYCGETKDSGTKKTGMTQAYTSNSNSCISMDQSLARGENDFNLHCFGGYTKQCEKVIEQSSDFRMVIDRQEKYDQSKDENKSSQETIEGSHFKFEDMESNDHINEYGAGLMAEDEKRCALEEIHTYPEGLYLDELDDDVLLHIASFLEARVVKYSLSKVCVRFQAMFDNEAYWKSRLLKRWPKKYPAVKPLSDFKWLDACVEREDSHRVWSDPAANTRHFMYSCNLFAEVDSVHLMKQGKLLLSGDRNRNMNVIDLSQYNHDLYGTEKDTNFKDMLVHSDCTIHKGWIWCMASVDNHLVTGSWDMHIRLFDINAQIVPFSSYKCKSAVLSLMAEENEIVASCFDKKVYFIDRRSNDIRSKNFHRQPVLSVAGNDQFIISGSEDKTISVFDRRAEKVMTRIKLENYPLCMSFRDNHLWFGDKRGQLHLYDANQGLFEYVGMYDVGHTDKVTGVISTRGAIFTCSGDSTIKVHTPSQDPDLIASFDVHSKEIAWLDYSHGVLASAGEDSIGVWLPKHWDVDTYLL